ncbi:DUF3108 domain-containing protein [Oceanobacter sp. 5_MG-2023]|uniref:DUF3108 domain-containing protein n=1 Tax=Oceanobacter sp. 5_MG-2023 TaxID=3062645 RepID=UPI0026E45417|nr:DUF3108 domain-containing protein [Oceanobacter sp. 5_MG-2023]MDO6682978.1 DUF3108 domain-containing protein [Oceanobacter sp. 5_MG-2023]
MRRIKYLACTLLLSPLLALASNGDTQPPTLDSTDSTYPSSTDDAGLQPEHNAIPDELPAVQHATLQPFRAQYTSRYEWGFFSFNIDAERRLVQRQDELWQMTFEADASAASVQEQAVFSLQDGIIQPQSYHYRGSGLIQEDDQEYQFDAARQRIYSPLQSREFNDVWQDKLQDKLTYMLQVSLDLASGQDQLSYQVFEKNRVRNYEFVIVAEEPLKTRIGVLDTIKIKQVRDDQRDIYAWLAKDKGYLLVKLVDRKKGKIQYQIDLVSSDL